MSRQTGKSHFRPSRLLVEAAVVDTPAAQRIVQSFPQLQPQTVDDANEILMNSTTHWDKASWGNTLLLAKQRGPFLRACPGTSRHLCCCYYNLDLAAGCDLGCSYCILQGYLNTPIITVYCNTADMFRELDERLSAHPHHFFRIGTGELSDSLSFEPFVQAAPDLVRFFAERANAVLELKSKNIHIEGLLGLEHRRRTVVAWSMNAEAVRRSDEGIAATIDERLAAAVAVQDAGYRLAFHFDPMINYPEWQSGYRETVDKIFDAIRPQNIAWISLGALRYPAAFDDLLRANFPQSTIYLGELLPGIDKKLRYFKPIRIEMFRKMHEWIRARSEQVFVYLCMESADVWQRAFGWAPKNSGELRRLLDEQVKS